MRYLIFAISVTSIFKNVNLDKLLKLTVYKKRAVEI